MPRDGRRSGKRMTARQAAISVARAAKNSLTSQRMICTINDVTDRETTGTITCNSPLSTNTITVHVRENVDLAANDRIWVRVDPGAPDLYAFDGFVDGGGLGNNSNGAVIPWTQTPGVTSPPGENLTVGAATGQTTHIGGGGVGGGGITFDDAVNLDLNDLADVNAGAPSDTQVLTWVGGSSKWQAQDAPTTGAWPGAGKCMIDQTEYSTFALAIAAASGGDLIKVGEGSFTCDNQTVPAGVMVLGCGPGVSTLTTATQNNTITVSNGCIIENITISITNTGTSTNAVYMSSGTATFRNVQVIVSTGAGYNGIGFRVNGNSELINCESLVSAGVTGWGLLCDGTGTITTRGGYYDGYGGTTSSDIDTGAATVTVNLQGPVLENGAINSVGTGAVTGWFSYGGAVYRAERTDTSNAGGVSSEFWDNDSSYPADWTETDAAATTNTNTKYSYWYLRGTSAEVSWDYNRKSSIDLENDVGSGAVASFMWGPILFRDGVYTADLDYYFGIYADNAGAIDTTTFVRVHVYWDSGGSIDGTAGWFIRGEEKDGATQHNGSWVRLDQKPMAPFYVRSWVNNNAAKSTRSHYGSTLDPAAHSVLLTQLPSSAPTWGDIWVRVHQSRGAGIEDYLLIGALDYVGNKP